MREINIVLLIEVLFLGKGRVQVSVSLETGAAYKNNTQIQRFFRKFECKFSALSSFIIRT